MLEDFFEEFAVAVTVCDAEGIILYMNQKSAATFNADGGKNLVGSNLFECHPQPARDKLFQMMKAQSTNVYTIEKMGQKKLIYQAPWFKQGKYAGFIELSIVIPLVMPHFIRKSVSD